MLSGAALAPLTIKSHVTYLMGIAIAWPIFRGRRWRVPLDLAAALVGSIALVVAFAPGILVDYAVGVIAAPPLPGEPPKVGGWLRFIAMMVYGMALAWIHFISTAIGAICLLVWLAAAARGLAAAFSRVGAPTGGATGSRLWPDG
jgi:hypothetical protein